MSKGLNSKIKDVLSNALIKNEEKKKKASQEKSDTATKKEAEEKEKAVVPNEEACKTLQEMGFSLEISKAALVKVKNDV